MSTSHRIQKIRNQSQAIPNRSTVKAIHRQRIPESGAVPAKAPEAVSLKECFESFQRKYDVDSNSPWWKKLFFWAIYMPFARFAYFKMRIVPMDHVNEKGQLGWIERQAVWSEQWQAEQDAERYPFGGVERLSFNASEDSCTCAPRSQFPNSRAKKRYERRAHKTVAVTESSMERLSRKLLETDPVVARYRTKSV
jgi:hypothetical protein